MRKSSFLTVLVAAAGLLAAPIMLSTGAEAQRAPRGGTEKGIKDAGVKSCGRCGLTDGRKARPGRTGVKAGPRAQARAMGMGPNGKPVRIPNPNAGR